MKHLIKELTIVYLIAATILGIIIFTSDSEAATFRYNCDVEDINYPLSNRESVDITISGTTFESARYLKVKHVAINDDINEVVRLNINKITNTGYLIKKYYDLYSKMLGHTVYWKLSNCVVNRS